MRIANPRTEHKANFKRFKKILILYDNSESNKILEA